LKLVQRNQRIEQDTIYKRLSSVDHWRFYSKHKNEITDHIEPLVAELSAKSGISQKNLDTTYESLDLVSAICQRYDPEVLYQELYDNLVAYTGEVIRKRVYGNWAINENFSGGKYPYISIGFKNIQYMPINAVWTAITGLDPIDLRKEAANEVRLNASKAKFERLKIQMNDPAYPEN
ncbi:MAG: hypothetical protein ACXVI9_10105, partial [Mucilaginibacter sp.]